MCTSSPQQTPQKALELELWKKAEEDRFRRQLQVKEDTLMKALAEEWKARDQQREVITRKKLEEYNKLEQHLKVRKKFVLRNVARK